MKLIIPMMITLSIHVAKTNTQI